ncbi:OmpA family protein [Roseateles sp. BYS180W]|uniref:OmpA family protein n=1 Tax=Roseateles rivi TaxID=3299028 RepID=A0ABW7FW67_9BURK
MHKLSDRTDRRTACVAALAFALLALTGCQSSAPPPAAPVLPAVKPSQIIPIAQIDRGVMIVMPTEKVGFDFDKATISDPAAMEFLDRVAALLRDKTTASIALEGHTDSQGTQAYNLKLSQARAASVKNELVSRGVATERITTAGFSYDRPVAPNDTEQGRRFNRRVELIILGEQLGNITRGEPANSFEQAYATLKARVDADAEKLP